MKQGVENMYKREDHYYAKIDKGYLYKELDTHYSAETDLVSNLMSYAITDDLVETRHELAVANECLWSLNDRDEEYGFSHSDRTHEIRNIIETTDFERKFLQAETELVTINRLEKSPKNDTVRAYMKMNDKLKEGMVA